MNKENELRCKSSFFYATFFYLLFSVPAYAYVDPGSGSVIVTTILGFIAAIGYTFRKFFYNLRAKITGKKVQEEDRSIDD